MPKMHKAFIDADGAASLSQIVEIAAALPEAIKSVPVDKLQELLPALQEIMAIAEAVGVAPAAPEVEVEEEMVDEDPKPKEDEKMPITDSAAFKDAVKSAIASAVKDHAIVIDKARDFVDEAYCFTDKSTVQIMRDALAVEHGATQFTDAELPVAFKLLKKASQDYKTFGDHAAEGGLTARLKASMKEDQ